MKTKVASGICRKKKRNNFRRGVQRTQEIQEQCLGGHQHLTGQWAMSNASSNRGKRKKKLCCFRPLDDCNTDFLQEMKTISIRSLKQQLKIKCLTNTQNFHSFQNRKAQSRFIKVNSFCKPGANGYYIFWCSLQMLTSNTTKLCEVFNSSKKV